MGIVPTPESDRRRFWTKVVKEDAERVPGLGPCWIWSAACFGNGYGAFRLGNRQRRAHIVSFEWHIGPTNGMLVCHRCDVRACVNPGHLFLGTQGANIRDALAKGRMASGLRSGMHTTGRTTLAEKDVVAIHQLIADGVTQQDIAAQYGVSQTLISHIALGKIWRHLELPVLSNPGNPRLHDETVRSIRAMVKAGLSYRKVGKAHGCSASAVWRIATGAAYPNVQ